MDIETLKKNNDAMEEFVKGNITAKELSDIIKEEPSHVVEREASSTKTS